MTQWEQSDVFGLPKILNETFSVLQNVLEKEYENLQLKAKLLADLQKMKEDSDD